MSRSEILLRPATLWSALQRRTRHALAHGALQPIRTEQVTVTDSGVRFLVRVVSSLARKAEDRERREARDHEVPPDPFLPYEPELFVAQVSDTHLALLNRFNVIDHHLLIVTRGFEHQESLLNAADFQALAACMAEYESLGFYNAGVEAGASQTHKHLQLIPLPLAPEGPALPIEPLIHAAPPRQGIARVPGLALRHALARLDPAGIHPGGARMLQDTYRRLLDSVGLKGLPRDGETRQSGPYNLLLTRGWMLLVPRSRECVASISINALGFAGSLFVRDRTQLETVRRLGPLSLLRAVGLPPAAE
jgi:ATP adenylyltransferase